MRLTSVLLSVSALVAAPMAVTGAEIDHLHVYLTGAAAPCGWDGDLPEEMTPVGSDTFVWDGWLSEGEFKFINTPGNWETSLVAPSAGKAMDGVEAVSDLWWYNYGACPDWKFYNNKAGMVRILVNLTTMKVTVKRPAVALVGPAVLGWESLENIIPIFSDNDGNINWTGQLRAGEIKILGEGATDWHPCFNAPKTDLALNPGSHHIVYNTATYNGDGEFTDFNYTIPRAGLYTLTFDLEGNSLAVSRADEPSLQGRFTGPAGTYLVGVDRQAQRVHIGPSPTRLFIGTSADDCQELEAQGDGNFSGELKLKAGNYYKLCSDPTQWSLTTISPSHDVDISTTATTNLSPMEGYSYTVATDDTYRVKASVGATPMLQALSTTTTAAEKVDNCAPQVVSHGGMIDAVGTYHSASVIDLSGHTVARLMPARLMPGVYIVIIDNAATKVIVR